VKQIVCYLKGTADKGIIFTTVEEASMECYVDVDFAGAYDKEGDGMVADRLHHIHIRSTCVLGIQTTDQNCPQHYGSRTHSTVYSNKGSTWTLKSIGRDLERNGCIQNLWFIALSPIFEDNNSALVLAKSPTLTPCSKHFATKYHFFKSHLKENGGVLDLQKIDSKDQAADIFTKLLDQTLFTAVRKMVMGW
jgi:hypothetical protein